MSTHAHYALPKGAELGKAGKQLWHAVMTDYKLDQVERLRLEAACRQADLITQLEEAIARDGVMVIGSQGQPRINPAVAALGSARLTLGRLVRELKLPDLDEKEPLMKSVYSPRARTAAMVRWHRP